jgi:hypothetical protein
MMTALQNLREEVAMNIDGDDEDSQRARIVSNYGVEVDFDSLDERGVSKAFCRVFFC